MTKKQLRNDVKKAVSQLSAEEKCRQSEAILADLENRVEFKTAQVVLLFWSLPNEVCTHSFVEKWAEKKTILLPVVEGDNLVLRKFEHRDALVQGAFGVHEPATSEVFTDYSQIDLCIVPGLAFDKSGNRLGYGKGFYDRLLPTIANAVTMGICFNVQLLEDIPCCDVWDEKVDEVISYGLHCTNKKIKR